MSTLLRIAVMALAWLAFFLATFYGCIRPTCCGQAAAAVTDVAPPIEPGSKPAAYTVVTTTDRPSITTGDEWPALLERLRERYERDPSQQLRIVGNFYPSEPNPPAFGNAGEARADTLAKLVRAALPGVDIIPSGRVTPGNAPLPGTEWLAASFDWTAGNAAGVGANAGAEMIRLSEREVKIRFPFNSQTGDLTPAINDYLAELAERMQRERLRLRIVGHTDDVGSPVSNERLGRSRAEFVKRQLIAVGAPAASIVTDSEGETAPEVPNTSEGNRTINRRVVVTLIEG